MRKQLILLVALCCLGASQAAMCKGKPKPDAHPNLFPPFTSPPVFLKEVKNGKLYMLTNNDTSIPVVHLWGTPYEKGFARGQLTEDRLEEFINGVWMYLRGRVKKALNESITPPLPDAVLDILAEAAMDVMLDNVSKLSGPSTGPWFGEEMRGIADATGVSIDRMRRIHMLGELTRGRCSMLGQWGKGLADPTGLITMRALDWDMTGPFKNFPELTVYHAYGENEVSFVNIGWSGWVGSLSGVNEAQLSVHEIGVAFPDETWGNETTEGVPFTYVIRDILQFDRSRVSALTRLQNANRTCHLILGVGDGKDRSFNSIQYNKDDMLPMDDTNLRPVADWHPRIPGTVYHGMDWLCPPFNDVMAHQIQKNFGKMTPELAIREVMPMAATGDLHVYVTDLVQQLLWVSFARSDGKAGPLSAYDRQYFKLDVKDLWSVKAPAL